MMGNTGTTRVSFAAHCRDWLREAAQPWPHLQSFVEQMLDKLQIREFGGRVQQTLPETPYTVSQLVHWFGQWLLGMGPTQTCDNTVRIARACQAFLFSGELDRRALSRRAKEALEELLEYTQLIETVLLMGAQRNDKSLQLTQLTEAIHHTGMQLSDC